LFERCGSVCNSDCLAIISWAAGLQSSLTKDKAVQYGLVCS
jgi:hypothetical protein